VVPTFTGVNQIIGSGFGGGNSVIGA
jgi:hypothetical protein